MNIPDKDLAKFYNLNQKTIFNYRHEAKKEKLYKAMRLYYIQEGLKNETKQI